MNNINTVTIFSIHIYLRVINTKWFHTFVYFFFFFHFCCIIYRSSLINRITFEQNCESYFFFDERIDCQYLFILFKVIQSACTYICICAIKLTAVGIVFIFFTFHLIAIFFFSCSDQMLTSSSFLVHPR